MAWADFDERSISLAKLEYGAVFRIRLDGGYAYFRAITRGEAADLGLSSGILGGDQEDLLIKTSLIYPEFDTIEIDTLPAGLPSSICEKILQVSGLAGARELSKRYNEVKSKRTIFHTISSTICAAFPSINPYELDDLPLSRLLELLMIAEDSLNVQMMVATGTFGEIDFIATDDSEPQSEESLKKKMDAEIRNALAAGAAGLPAGFVDRTTKAPPGVVPPNPPDTGL